METNTEIKKVSPTSIALKWALIAILMNVITIMTNLYINDGRFNPRSGGWIMFAINLFILVLPMVMTIKEYRDKEMEGFITYGKAFNAAFVFSLFLVLFNILFMLVFYNFVIDFDTFVSEQVDIGIQAMKEKGMSDETIKKNLAASPAFLSTQWFSLSMVLVGGLIFDSIIALIVAAILKRNRPANA